MSHAAILYLIAAPIGNLQDISLRALATLRQVPLVAAEDTRRARTLLSAHGIAGKKYLSLRAHNENHAAAQIVRHLQSGEDAAYLSDAGAPGVSDPGARLARAVRAAGCAVSPLPGASALTAMMSAAGMREGAVHFMGFAPRAPAARRRFFEQLPLLAGNIMLFESPRRMENAVSLLREFFGDNARAVVGRELTKAHEQIEDMPLSELSAALSEGKIPLRGEFSLMVESPGASPLSLAGRRLFEALAKELPPRKAAAIAAQFGEESAADHYRRHLAKKPAAK